MCACVLVIWDVWFDHTFSKQFSAYYYATKYVQADMNLYAFFKQSYRACASCSYVIGPSVHLYIYVYMYVYDPIESLNGTLAVDLPFQTLAVDFLSNLYRLALPLRAPETTSSLSKSRISLFNVPLALFVQWMTQYYGRRITSVSVVVN